MATFNEQILDVWEEWEESSELDSNDPDEFLTWALAMTCSPSCPHS